MQSNLSTEIKYLPGIGPKRGEILDKELGIKTFRDMLYYFPYRWVDKSQVYPIIEILKGEQEGVYIQLRGTINKKDIIGGSKGKKRLVLTLQDATGKIDLVFFSGIKWIDEKIKIGEEYIVFGKLNNFNGNINMVHPEIDTPQNALNYGAGHLTGIYSLTEKMKNSGLGIRAVTKIENTLLEKTIDSIQETLPEYIIQENNLCPLKFALKNIHFPTNNQALKEAQYRLKFEELFYLQLSLLKQKHLRQGKLNGIVMNHIGENFYSCYNALPFTLTNGQKRVIKEIRADMKSGKQMNRLLQGDVGSGKTLVAVLSALIAIDNGYQACIMAPTEVLANQHLKSIEKFLLSTNAKCALLTGSTKQKERKSIHEGLVNGEIDILIGTHALIEENVRFKNLGLSIIDEQHRFGVEQRSKLWKKNSKVPHILVMTATPIPRTLAMTLYGDLDLSIIDELPPNRKPIITKHVFENKRQMVFDFMREQIKKGRQIYVVYPLIKDNEKLDYENLEIGYLRLLEEFPTPPFVTAVVHGQLKTEEKDYGMNLFASGKANILVATSVIEVGVDVPNATMIVIESSERFGLSQLHQLRGRVGRGKEQSYCILMSGVKLSKEGRKRLELMCNTTDGFTLAEEDMKMRGPGDIEGTSQSGLAIDLNIASLYKDSTLLEEARRVAEKILEEDPLILAPKNRVLEEQLIINRKKGKEPKNYSLVS